MEQSYFIFREPMTFDELKALLLLRYTVYRASRLHKFCPPNEAGIDLDCYDLFSRHFGLFEHTGLTSRPVGYVRVVSEEEGIFRNELFELAKLTPSVYEKVNRIPKYPLPLMSYFPDAERVKDYHAEIKSLGQKLVETSRLSLDHSVRGRQVCTNFVAAVFASSLVHGVERSVLTCTCEHEGFYRGYGFTRLEGTRDYFIKSLDYHAVCLTGSAKGLPSPMREKVVGMALIYGRFGRICFDKSNPNDYFAPLGTYQLSRPVFGPA